MSPLRRDNLKSFDLFNSAIQRARPYKKGRKEADETFNALNLTRHTFHGE